MDNKVLKSIRLDPDVLQKVDELAAKHSYWTRSSIINNLLSVVLKCSTDGTLWNILSKFYPYEKGFVIKFEKDDEILKERNKPNYDD